MAAKVVHFEVHGTNGKRLQDFYASLFGWKVDAGRLGGKTLMEPHAVPGGPEIAMFQDPEGNAIGLIKTGSM